MPPAASTNNKRSPSIIGIDDGPFSKSETEITYAPLVAVCLKNFHITKVSITWITVDALDATRKAKAVLGSLPRGPVLLSGVTFGGFNLIDPRRILEQFKNPTIVVVGSRPDNRAVKRALVKHFPDWRVRWDVIRSLGPLRRVRTVRDEPPIYYESFGCTAVEARGILKANALVSRVPEPLRAAGLVARGMFEQAQNQPQHSSPTVVIP